MPRKAKAPFVMPILNPVKVESFYKTAELKYKQLCILMDIKYPNKYFNKTDFDPDSIFKINFGFSTKDEPSIEYVFAQICYHRQNVGNALPNILKLSDKTFATDFKKNLMGFNPYAVVTTYGTFSKLMGEVGKYYKTSKVVKDYFTTIWNCASFLNANPSIKNRKDFIAHLLSYKNSISHFRNKIAIKGFGIALTCDLLKELDKTGTAFNNLCKPDRHIKNAVQVLCNSTNMKENDVIEAFKKIVDEINKIPGCSTTVYKLDRMLYLLLSGKFFLDESRDSFHNYYLGKVLFKLF